MNISEVIKERRSIREFTAEDVAEEDLAKVLEAGRWAPSGLNNQPWRFVIVRDTGMKQELSGLTHYGKIIKEAPVNITVFMDESAGYDRTKDLLAIGACIQNMLLEVHSLGLGAVWLGEILKNKEKVAEILKTPADWELMAVVAVGHPVNKERTSERKTLDELIFCTDP